MSRGGLWDRTASEGVGFTLSHVCVGDLGFHLSHLFRRIEWVGCWRQKTLNLSAMVSPSEAWRTANNATGTSATVFPGLLVVK